MQCRQVGCSAVLTVYFWSDTECRAWGCSLLSAACAWRSRLTPALSPWWGPDRKQSLIGKCDSQLSHKWKMKWIHPFIDFWHKEGNKKLSVCAAFHRMNDKFPDQNSKRLLFICSFFSFNLDADRSTLDFAVASQSSPHISGFQMMCSPDGSPTPAHSSSCWRQSCQRTSPRRSGLWARNVKDSKQMQVTWNSCTEPKQLSTKAIDWRCWWCSTTTPDLNSPQNSLAVCWETANIHARTLYWNVHFILNVWHPSEQGYTHCLIRGPMSLPETLEMDLRKAWVDRSIWLHIWLWYFWEEAVLARLRSLLKTCRQLERKNVLRRGKLSFPWSKTY